MFKYILTITLFMVFIAPFAYFGFFIIWLFWDSYKYNQFEDNLIKSYRESGHELLQVSVCHEWKCIFEYRDGRSNYKFLISGETDLDQRFQKLLYLSSNLDQLPEGCRFIQQGSNLCQL